MPIRQTPFFTAIDLIGTFVLAIQGASVAAVHGLDALGVLVISLVSAMGGGIIRDVLIGSHPPEALRGWRLVTVALAGGLLTFLAYHTVKQIPEILFTGIDAVGLSLIAVTGTEKALEYKLSPVVAMMMGAVSGVGGGTLRDILLAQVPAVLRTDFLATPVIIDATVLIVARKLGMKPQWAATLGGTTCCVLRVIAVWQHWHLPTAAL